MPTKRNLEETLRDGDRLPSAFTKILGDTVAALLSELGRSQPVQPVEELEPVAVTPGSLGAWSDDDV